MSYHSRQPSIASSLISSSTHNHPAKIGPWKLGKTLGRGATGRVLLGTHSQTGQKAAVKVVSKSELNEDYENDNNNPGGLPYGIEREIIIMKLLTHPNVLRLYDVWETSKALYLVLEYVEGGELFDLLVERGPLQEVEAIKYFRQIILGTAYCHALGICHRDLKPENLLLDSNLNVKLADFGMAALESNGKLLETSCGSPHYAAPEIVSGLKYHGAASDIWSCGVILFALLTGRLPFDDENIRNLLLKVQAGNFEIPDELSFEAKDLICKMLTVDPLDRIQTEKILNHPLLKKYPIPNEDLISFKSLPHPETAYKSLGSIKNIDKQILQNLSILWHDRSQQDITDCLLKNGSNPEKTFYALLLRYRHNQEDLANNNNSIQSSPKKFSRSNSQKFNNASNTPNKKKRLSQMSASSSRNRPVLFQYKNGKRISMSNNPRLSAASSVNNSPFKSPTRNSKRMSYGQSPNRRSPLKYSDDNAQFQNDTPPAIPRNIYDEIVNAQTSGSMGSMPPTLPSKDSIYGQPDEAKNKPSRSPNPIVDEVSDAHNAAFNSLASAPTFSPNKEAAKSKRGSIIKSLSKNRLSMASKRKSIRNSMTTGLKRNSITVKLLSTYAKLAGESDWEYMDKQTRRTSANFATLCDKIFNQEEYDEDDENLVDEEEKQAREYEKLMEIERKKHEAEIRARKELAKQKKRLKRKSLMSSKKLSFIIKNDEANNSDLAQDSEVIDQPKRGSKHRSASEGHAGIDIIGLNDELTADDVENLKRRTMSQPEPRQRRNPVLTRRPVSRLDPLWTAYENEELTRAQDALEAEYKDSKQSSKSKEKLKKKANRESMVSVFDQEVSDGEGVERNGTTKIYGNKGKNLSRNDFEDADYELPDLDLKDSKLSEEYMSEIRKSKLLNSKPNVHSLLKEDVKGNRRISTQSYQGKVSNIDVAKQRKQKDKERETARIERRQREIDSRNPSSTGDEQRKTLISDVQIPTVTRKSRHFTNSNKRLSVLTMRSTKESYRDLNSILNGSDDEDDPTGDIVDGYNSGGMPTIRTSFADRLDRAGLNNADEDEEEPLDEGSIMDFDEHLSGKRSSYYAAGSSGANARRYSKYNTNKKSSRPASRLPDLPDGNDVDTDDSFATKDSHRRSKYSLNDDHETEDTDFFDNIKLPDEKPNKAAPSQQKRNSASKQRRDSAKEQEKSQGKSKGKSYQPDARSMLMPSLDNEPSNNYQKVRNDNSKSRPAQPQQKSYQNQNSDTDTIPPTPPAHHDGVSKIPLNDSTNRLASHQPEIQPPQKRNRSIFRKLSWGSKKALEEPPKPTTNGAGQLPSPADSRSNSVEEKKGNSFFRWLSGSHQEVITPAEIKRYYTILPKHEMATALFALLNSWTNFGLKELKNDSIGYNITGSISKHNAFNLKSCKFRIKINTRDFNQKSEIVCARVKGSKVTTDTLFKEIEKVLKKEGVLDAK